MTSKDCVESSLIFSSPNKILQSSFHSNGESNWKIVRKFMNFYWATVAVSFSNVHCSDLKYAYSDLLKQLQNEVFLLCLVYLQ